MMCCAMCSSHVSRSESGSPLYCMVPLCVPGESSEGIVFKDSDIKYPMIVVQYALSWERELLEASSMKRD